MRSAAEPPPELGEKVGTHGYRRGPEARTRDCGAPQAADMLAAAMTGTPWGDAGGLRGRRLRPGPGTPREEVRRNQRERLMAATVAAVEARGYGATTVADLIAVSGVSRSAFYRHFDNREECFLATLEEILAAALATVGSRYRREVGWEERAREALATFFALLVDQPAAARLVLIESYAAGPRAAALVEQAYDDFTALAEEATAQLPGREEMPAEMLRAVVGGLRELIQARLLRGEEAELATIAPALLEAALAYRAPTGPLPAARRQRDAPVGAVRPSPQELEDPAERIIAAATATMAARGCAATTLDAVVAEAGVSLSTLYEHFDNKEALLEAALDAGQARLFAAAAPAYRRGRDWPESVRGAIAATLRALTADPEFAQLGTVEVYRAGRRVLERRERTVGRFARLLGPGYELGGDATPVAAELALGAVLTLIHERVRAGRGSSLPELTPLATYIVLAPFLGAEAASAVARGEARRE